MFDIHKGVSHGNVSETVGHYLETMSMLEFKEYRIDLKALALHVTFVLMDAINAPNDSQCLYLSHGEHIFAFSIFNRSRYAKTDKNISSAVFED